MRRRRIPEAHSLKNVIMKKNTIQMSSRLHAQVERRAVIILFLAPTVIGLVLFQFLPLAMAIRNSFFNYSLMMPDRQSFIGLENYLRLFSDTRFLASIRTTFIFALAILMIQLPLGLILALMVRRSRPLVGLLRSTIFIPVVTSMTVAAVIWNLMYHPENGLLNALITAVGLPRQPFLTSADQALAAIIVMTIWQEVGLTMTIFLSGLQGIPIEYYEAASIDGASRLQLFKYVTLPLLRRTIVFAVITSTIFSFTIFASVYVMTKGGPINSTRVVIFHIFEQAFRLNEVGYASAQAIFLMVIMAIVALVQSRLMRTEFEY